MNKVTAISDALTNHDNFFDLTSGLIHGSIDFVCDGELLEDLEACEKTFIGTRVQKQLMKKFNLPKGGLLDTEIAGHPVDVKFTLGRNWMIPPECVGHACILITADTNNLQYSLGVFEAHPENLTKGGNRDRKVSVSAAGKKNINWLCENHPLKRSKNV